jgi:hypothetical protein
LFSVVLQDVVCWFGLDEASFPGIALPPPLPPSSHSRASVHPTTTADTATTAATAAAAARRKQELEEEAPPVDNSKEEGNGGFVMWGLTLGVVADLAEAAAHPLPLIPLFGQKRFLSGQKHFLGGKESAFFFLRFERAHWAIDSGFRFALLAAGNVGGMSRRRWAVFIVAIAVLVRYLLSTKGIQEGL